MRDNAGNLPPQPGIFPDFTAPVVRMGEDGVRELVTMRWGMPSSQKALFDASKARAQKLEAKGKNRRFRRAPAAGAGQRHNQYPQCSQPHWKRWLGTAHRCVVPFTSFSEFNKAAWRRHLVRAGRQPAAGGVRRPVDALDLGRKIKEGETTNDLSAFSPPSQRRRGAIHPKAMPVILTTRAGDRPG